MVDNEPPYLSITWPDIRMLFKTFLRLFTSEMTTIRIVPQDPPNGFRLLYVLKDTLSAAAEGLGVERWPWIGLVSGLYGIEAAGVVAGTSSGVAIGLRG